MNILTKFRILKPASEVFEAFVDPLRIGNFWWSSSSERWEQGKTITLRYDEYNAEVNIKVTEIDINKKIVFKWGELEENTVTISMKEVDELSTIIEVNEEGFNENEDEIINTLVDNKEGWVYMLTCLKAYLEFGITELRAGIVK
ncbi:SRPBCC domain-containing protein [Bacillus sp. Cr_A10]|uniref:SRPBCC domain-containing protein n=1 Tax=Bacillus sp. Cr_A10 TaxID=3033993 RepID=UPI0023DA9441|nr:SRPBCC domain-containing protein [Bacillus sp. Cr_A10]MDF2068467.1 SRPBCC domain-containing protein [Bacillus sp. Cr_A10]